jgi:aromatic-L-amino-acid/L-tryptophan decarboxylase
MIKTIEQELQELEKISRELEPSHNQRVLLREQVTTYSDHFVNSIDELKTFYTSKDKSKEIYEHPIGKPYPMQDLINLYERAVRKEGLNAASGGHLGYIPGGGITTSALGDYLAATTNVYAGVFFGSPGAVRIEQHLINWVAKEFNYGENFGGNITSGGSIANLTAIVCARDAKNINADNIRQSVIYGSPHMHHCLDKAIRIAGLKECIYRPVTLNEQFQIDADLLKQQVEKDLADGLNPFLIIGSAGTTNLGAVDPLNTLADICQAYNIWFHVDGAYGGFFYLLDEKKELLNGITRSDSFVIDPHKGLFLPYGTGMVLVKDKEYLLKSHYYQANYMQDAVANADEFSPADMSAELTKHFRGLRMWLPLMLHGVEPFRAALKEKLLLTRYFYERLKEIPEMVTGPLPDLSVLIFRVKLEGKTQQEEDAINKEILQAIHNDGTVFISSTNVSGKFALRIAVLSFRTHKFHIDFLITLLKEKVEALKKEGKI